MFPEAWEIRLLVGLSMLIYLFLLHRVLNRMRMDGFISLVLVLAMIGGGLLAPVSLWKGLSFNWGGMFIPLAIVVYLIIKADTSLEKWRGLVTALLVGAAVWGVDRILPGTPGFGYELDPLYIPAVFAGVIAYLLGRSRRSAFIGGVGGILVLDLAAWGENMLRSSQEIPIVLGGAGVFDAILVAGVFAVLLAELVGEIRERTVS